MTTRTPTPRTLDIELLAIDLSTCTRCTGTLANIEAAIEKVRQVTEPIGTAIHLRKTLIDSEEAARRHRFVTSPTLRVDGRDVAFETRESLCDSCTDLCGCAEGTQCRVWSYQGEEHTEAPVGLIVEALLGALAVPAAPPAAPVSSPAVVPENLQRFFAGRAARAATSPATCCPPAAQATCCEAAEKATCCAPEAASCGCA